MELPPLPFGLPPEQHPAGPGLWVASANPHPFAAMLGFRKEQDHRPVFPEELIGVWMVASDYYVLGGGDVTPERAGNALLTWLLMSHTRTDLLMGLAALNHTASEPDATARWMEQYRSILAEGPRERFDAALAGDGDGRRVFLTRPTILRAMRLVAERTPPAEDERLAVLSQYGDHTTWDLRVTVTLITHLVAEFLGLDKPDYESDPDDRLSGLPARLALEMVCSGMSTRAENHGNLLGRTRMLYVDYGPKVVRNPARRPPLALVEEALAMPLDDALAIGFTYYGQMATYDWDGHTGVRFQSPLPYLDVPESSWRRFLDLFSQTDDEFAASASQMTGDWQMRSIQERPLLRLGDDVVVLDERFLMERITSGLFWVIHDHEKVSHGETARHRWTQAYGEMHEMLVETYFAGFAPPVLVGDPLASVFTEEDLAAAVGDGKRIDVGIDFGHTVLIADAQAGQLSTKTREEADLKAFKNDLEKIVLKKARQLHETAACLMEDPAPPMSPIGRPATRIAPVVVPGGTFPNSAVTRRYISEQLEHEGLLSAPGIDPLVVLDLRDLEHAEAVRASTGTDLISLIHQWQESGYREASLSDWLIVTFDEASLDRPGILRDALEASFDVIKTRIHETNERPGGRVAHFFSRIWRMIALRSKSDGGNDTGLVPD